jgi:HlyD family secretion protein
MKRWLIRTAAVLGLVLLGLGLRATVFATRPIEVEVTAVARGRVEETVSNSRAGTIKARRRAQLSPEVGGRVLEIPHREGERVKAGDVLLRLDSRVQQAQIDLTRRELQATLAQRSQACVAAERAEREVGRLRRLANEGIVSTDVLDQAQTSAETSRAACRAAAAGVEQGQAAVELARRQTDLLVLRAPFDGVVADVAIEIGEYTTPSPPAVPVPPVLDIIDPGSVYVSAPMDEVDSARIQPGQPARVTIDSYPGQTFTGRVSRIAPYVVDREEQNRTVEIEVEIDAVPPSVRLLPGTSADVEVILQAREGVVRLPTPSLLEGDKVLVAAGDTLEERTVRIGIRNWDWTEVLGDTGGVAPGDLVVTSLDRPEVKAGARVQPVRKEGDAAAP